MSKRFLLRGAAAACIAVLSITGCANVGEPRPDRDRERAEARLEQMLEGRTAGEPRACITAYNSRRLQILHRTAVVFENGDTIWVSRPSDPDSLDSRDIVIIERSGSELCKQDVIRTVDRGSRFVTGVIFLRDFVPYRRP